MIFLSPMTNDSPVIAISPFCAEAMQKSTLSLTMSNGIMPSDDVVSTTNIALWACAMAPISRIGFSTPVPVSWCVVYTNAMSGFSSSVFSTAVRSGTSNTDDFWSMCGMP